MAAPVYLLGLGLASLASLANGVNPFSSGVFANPAIWIPLFGTSGLAGLMLLVATSRKTVIAFSFDSETRAQLCRDGATAKAAHHRGPV